LCCPDRHFVRGGKGGAARAVPDGHVWLDIAYGPHKVPTPEIEDECLANPATFNELFEIVEQFQDASDVSWFRGCRRASYKLSPSISRHPTKKTIDDLFPVETELRNRFAERSPPFLTRALGDDWDKYFLMQHYGVPTRLLDWSESPFVGLYFALMPLTITPEEDAALWMCNPAEWNRAVADLTKYEPGILDQFSPRVQRYLPNDGRPERVPNEPIMMFGSHNSPRMAAQRGGFTVFGQNLTPLEDVKVTKSIPDNVLRKVTINKSNIEPVLDSLMKKAITESFIFPDLEGLAKELKRKSGFKYD
jgi:hypothetical protein